MASRIRAHIRGNVVGYLALFIALSGTAYAVDKVGSKDIKRNAVKGKHVKDASLRAKHFAPGQLPVGPQGLPGTPGTNTNAPAGAVSFFNLAACPSGWTELTAARGRYIVGLPTGGTLAGTAGTALSNLQNRSVGRHDHSVADPSHFHDLSRGHDDSDTGSAIDRAAQSNTSGLGVFPATTGITVNDAGSVAGTNAPYIQLRVCQKS